MVGRNWNSQRAGQELARLTAPGVLASVPTVHPFSSS